MFRGWEEGPRRIKRSPTTGGRDGAKPTTGGRLAVVVSGPRAYYVDQSLEAMNDGSAAALQAQVWIGVQMSRTGLR